MIIFLSFSEHNNNNNNVLLLIYLNVAILICFSHIFFVMGQAVYNVPVK